MTIEALSFHHFDENMVHIRVDDDDDVDCDDDVVDDHEAIC